MSNFICFLILGIEGCCWTSTTNDYIHILLLDPHLAESPIKLSLSVSLSICQFSIFLRNGSLVFSDFWHNIKRQSFYKLVLSFLLEVPRHVQNTQNRKLVIFLQYVKKLLQLLCVLLGCKTFRYFTGVQSCLLSHVIMTISLRKLQSSVWYGRTAKIQKLQILQIYPKCYCTFNIAYQTY